MTFLFIYSVILIFQSAIRKVRGEDLTTIAKTLEASISQELNLEYEIEVDEHTTFTLSGILPIFNYQKRTIESSLTERINYNNVSLLILFKLNITHKVDNFTQINLSRENLMESLNFKNIAFIRKQNENSFFYPKPIFGVVKADFKDLGEYDLYDELIRENFFYSTVFNSLFEEHLDNILLKYPKTSVMRNFEYVIGYIEMIKKFNVNCCKELRIYTAAIKNINYAFCKTISFYSGDFQKVSMVLYYWESGKEHKVKVTIESILFSKTLVTYNTFSPAEPLIKKLVTEIFDEIAFHHQWEED